LMLKFNKNMNYNEFIDKIECKQSLIDNLKYSKNLFISSLS
jgi:hypothetical protein